MTNLPPTAQPDEKDWTWVVKQACPDCGMDVSALTIQEVARLNKLCARNWFDVLQTHPAVSARPQPHIWSPLEYGCHVRDVFRLFTTRLNLMLDNDNPEFKNWDPNVTATEQRYDLANPAIVAQETLEAGINLGELFASIRPDQTNRKGRRTDGAQFTVETFARYEIHDPIHHLWDVGVSPSSYYAPTNS